MHRRGPQRANMISVLPHPSKLEIICITLYKKVYCCPFPCILNECMKRPKNALIVALCATVRGTCDFRVTVRCQGLEFIFRFLKRCADSCGHHTDNIIVVELHDLQSGQIRQFGRNIASQLVGIQPQTTKSSQSAEFCWDRSSQGRVGDGDGSEFGQESNLRRDFTDNLIAVQPQGD